MKILLLYVKCRPSTVLGLVLLTKHKWFYQAYCMKNVISASTKQIHMWKLLLVHYRKVLGLCLLLNTISVTTKTYRPRAMAMIWICRAAIQSNLSQKITLDIYTLWHQIIGNENLLSPISADPDRSIKTTRATMCTLISISRFVWVWQLLVYDSKGLSGDFYQEKQFNNEFAWKFVFQMESWIRELLKMLQMYNRRVER